MSAHSFPGKLLVLAAVLLPGTGPAFGQRPAGPPGAFAGGRPAPMSGARPGGGFSGTRPGAPPGARPMTPRVSPGMPGSTARAVPFAAPRIINNVPGGAAVNNVSGVQPRAFVSGVGVNVGNNTIYSAGYPSYSLGYPRYTYGYNQYYYHGGRYLRAYYGARYPNYYYRSFAYFPWYFGGLGAWYYPDILYGLAAGYAADYGPGIYGASPADPLPYPPADLPPPSPILSPVASPPGFQSGGLGAAVVSIPPADKPAPPESPRVAATELLLNVRVPADAVVWVNGVRTRQTGESRQYITTALTPGRAYTYEVRAAWWTEAGRPVERTRQVKVQPGEVRVVDFFAPADR